MPKVLPANAVEVSHNKEAFCLVFRFQSPDHQEAVYISISPAGAQTTVDLISKELQEFEKETGQAVTAWEVNPNQTRNGTPTS
jgi:hypothetical protein